jgi:Fic family protein
MNIDKFGPNKTGKLVAITGIPGATHSFIPDALPPNWSWPTELWQLLKDASVALARLDEVGKYLPNPELLMNPLRDREAQQSSRLEGTITSVRQQLLFEVEPKPPSSETDPANEFKEVSNYKKALRLHEELKHELPISLRLIKELHRALMEGVRGANREPGEFRRLPIQIDDPPRFIPPPADRMLTCLDQFEKSLHSGIMFDPLVDPFVYHYQFETIHPFRDGNGRVGRLLLSILIEELFQLSGQWLYMSSYFASTKAEYLDRLLSISTAGDWEGWIEYCLKGVIIESEQSRERCAQLRDLVESFRRRIEGIGGHSRLSLISDSLFNFPAIRVTDIVSACEVSFPTARKYANQLVGAGILQEFPDAKQLTFYAPEILAVSHGNFD